MTYSDIQKILEINKLARKTTLVEKMIYSGWEAPGVYGNNFRNWDDEVTNNDLSAICEWYAPWPHVIDAITNK